MLPFITTAALMVIIFIFSSQTAEESSKISAGLTLKIVLFVTDFFKIDNIDIENLVGILHNIIRKCAHFAIYFSLGISSIFMFLTIIKNSKLASVISAGGFCMLYAVSDEIHQNFVSGRGPGIKDVFIDTMGGFAGACFGILIYIIVMKFLKKYKYNKII